MRKKTDTWFTSWWGWRRGSVRERALELEERGRGWFFLEFEFGYRSEAERSKGAAPPPPPFCICCCRRIAAARARSWMMESSLLDDRFLDHLLLPPPLTAAADWFVKRLDCRFFTGPELRDKHMPISDWLIFTCNRFTEICTIRITYTYKYLMLSQSSWELREMKMVSNTTIALFV